MPRVCSCIEIFLFVLHLIEKPSGKLQSPFRSPVHEKYSLFKTTRRSSWLWNSLPCVFVLVVKISIGRSRDPCNFHSMDRECVLFQIILLLQYAGITGTVAVQM